MTRFGPELFKIGGASYPLNPVFPLPQAVLKVYNIPLFVIHVCACFKLFVCCH